MFKPGDKVRCVNIHKDTNDYFYYNSFMAKTDRIIIGNEYKVKAYYKFSDSRDDVTSAITIPGGEYSHPASMFEPLVTLENTMDLLDQKVAEYEQRIYEKSL